MFRFLEGDLGCISGCILGFRGVLYFVWGTYAHKSCLLSRRQIAGSCKCGFVMLIIWAYCENRQNVSPPKISAIWFFFGGGGVLVFLPFPSSFPFVQCSNYICFWTFPVQSPQGMSKYIRKCRMTLKLAGPVIWRSLSQGGKMDAQKNLVGISGPKKIFSPPPQIPRRHPPGPSPSPSPERPPPSWHFSIKIGTPPPPPAVIALPLPLPQAEKIKNIRNWDSFKNPCP